MALKELIRKLLHIEDTPERTALAYAIGVFVGFSPFLGFHTLCGIAIAFAFGLNRFAILLGVWSNVPWWVVPYYWAATWVGMQMTGFRIEKEIVEKTFRLAVGEGLLSSSFRDHLIAQWGFFLSFNLGSLVLAVLLGVAVYPLSLRGIKLYRARKGRKSHFPGPIATLKE